jgi:hypothetical protein
MEEILRPEEMVPYVREYLGLMEDLKVLDAEMKRCLLEYKKRREQLVTKKKPMAERYNQIEEVLKKTIHNQKLPGVKYKNYIFTLEEKVLYKRPEDKIAEALERNPVEHFANDRKTLARLIAQAVKKKCKHQPSTRPCDFNNTTLKIRLLG